MSLAMIAGKIADTAGSTRHQKSLSPLFAMVERDEDPPAPGMPIANIMSEGQTSVAFQRVSDKDACEIKKWCFL